MSLLLVFGKAPRDDIILHIVQSEGTEVLGVACPELAPSGTLFSQCFMDESQGGLLSLASLCFGTQEQTQSVFPVAGAVPSS